MLHDTELWRQEGFSHPDLRRSVQLSLLTADSGFCGLPCLGLHNPEHLSFPAKCHKVVSLGKGWSQGPCRQRDMNMG